MSDSLRPRELQHARPPCPSPTPGAHPNPCPLSQWCHPTISSTVVPFSSCPQSLPASESFQMSQLFTPGGQSIGISASTSVLPMNTQGWSPLEWNGWTSLQSKGLARVFSNTTVQKHQFFSAQLSFHGVAKSRIRLSHWTELMSSWVKEIRIHTKHTDRRVNVKTNLLKIWSIKYSKGIYTGINPKRLNGCRGKYQTQDNGSLFRWRREMSSEKRLKGNF